MQGSTSASPQFSGGHEEGSTEGQVPGKQELDGQLQQARHPLETDLKSSPLFLPSEILLGQTPASLHPLSIGLAPSPARLTVRSLLPCRCCCCCMPLNTFCCCNCPCSSWAKLAPVTSPNTTHPTAIDSLKIESSWRACFPLHLQLWRPSSRGRHPGATEREREEALQTHRRRQLMTIRRRFTRTDWVQGTAASTGVVQ